MSSLLQIAQLATDLIKQYQLSDYEISLTTNSGLSTTVRLGKVETLQHHLNQKFDVNVYFGQKKGSASSVDLSKQGIDKAIQSACLIAKYTKDDPFNGLAKKALMATNPPNLDLNYPWDLDAASSIEIAKECEAVALEQAEIDNSEGAEVATFKGNCLYANSNQLLVNHQNTEHSIYLSLIAKRNEQMQTAYEYSTAIDAKDLTLPADIGIKAAQLAQEKLGAQSLKPQKCPVIFTPRLSAGLFSQLLTALSGSRQYKKSTFLLNSIGKIVLPKNIKVLESPFAKKTLGARAFDLDGVLKKTQYFIKNGRVENYVMSQYSANQLGLETTANAGGVNNVIVDATCANGLDEMIKQMHQGLIVTELMGQGINSITGDYSRGATGFWVANGQIQYPVSGLTIAGNLADMLLNIGEIGVDADQRNNIKVGSVLIKQMTIAG